MHCDPSNVTRLLDRLAVTDGGNLVQRRRSDSDRRVVEVRLTDRGRETVSEHRRRRARDIPLFAGLGPDDRTHLELLLHEVASNLDTGRSDEPSASRLVRMAASATAVTDAIRFTSAPSERRLLRPNQCARPSTTSAFLAPQRAPGGEQLWNNECRATYAPPVSCGQRPCWSSQSVSSRWRWSRPVPV